jgi:hypothetical protein
VLETEYKCVEIGALAVLSMETSSPISLINVLAYTFFVIAAGFYICYIKGISDRSSLCWVIFLVANISCASQFCCIVPKHIICRTLGRVALFACLVCTFHVCGCFGTYKSTSGVYCGLSFAQTI